jgi:hypothetical protein
VDTVGDAQPALAPVPFRVGAEAAALEPEPRQSFEPALSGFGRRPSRISELVLPHDLERAGRRAHEGERGRERREVVLLDAARDLQQVGRDRRDAQDVAQRQDASLVSGVTADLEDDADDRLRAQGDGGERAGKCSSGQLAGDLVVEGLGEGPRADEREDGGEAHRPPPSPRRRRVSP